MKIDVKDNRMVLTSGKLEIFSLSEYIDKNITQFVGDRVEAFGLVPYKFYNKETDKKPAKVGIINCPSMMTFYPDTVDKNVEDGIWDGIYPEPNVHNYTRMTFYANDRIMDNVIIQKLDNVVMFMELLLGGKLDNNIPYTMLNSVWMKNVDANGTNLEVPATTMDLVIYEICRYNKSNDKPFGYVFGKDPKMSPIAYVFANIREICAANSVFAALSFEDMNSMLDASLNMTLQEREQKISPVEQIIKM